ncbi:MAG: class I SAM-dependent methyltransferase [Desulfosudis oleivorans]|nr:class I SAM-dependent methyltransferase [Desulfosudis oleivorans]
MRPAQGKTITDFIIQNKTKNILELGFYHGVSTCYLAGAVDELGEGLVVTIDKEEARAKSPNVEELLEKLNLQKYVKIYYEPRSYLWRLMKMIEDPSTPKFDLCYIDGGHNWYETGFAFLLVDKLMAPGGWVIFDDLDWSYDKCPYMRELEWVKQLPEEERLTPQVRKVYELLTKQNSSYHNFKEENNWGYAQKIS